MTTKPDLVISWQHDLIRYTKTFKLAIPNHLLGDTCIRYDVQRAPPKIIKASSFKRFVKVILCLPLGLCARHLVIWMSAIWHASASLN